MHLQKMDRYGPILYMTGNIIRKADYEWWMKRLRHNLMLYDILRLDHFRGFDEYFEIPAEDETAVNGEWVKGPGMDFLKQ